MTNQPIRSDEREAFEAALLARGGIWPVYLKATDWEAKHALCNAYEGWQAALASQQRRRAQDGGAVPERVEQMAINRYRSVPAGVLAYKVVAGDGSRSLYSGTKDSCAIVARRLTEAFLDGAYAVSQDAPQPAAAKQEAASVPEGWKLVPIKPTIEMLRFGDSYPGEPCSFIEHLEQQWANMLDAAPPAPSAEGEGS